MGDTIYLSSRSNALMRSAVLTVNRMDSSGEEDVIVSCENRQPSRSGVVKFTNCPIDTSSSVNMDNGVVSVRSAGLYRVTFSG